LGGGFRGGVEGDDAGGERLARGRDEAGIGDEMEHGGAAGELLDGIAEILVGGLLAGDDAGDERENVMEVELVRGSQNRGAGKGEIEDQEMAAGGDDARHFAQRAGPGLHIPQAEGNGDGIEGGVREGEMKGVGDDGVAEALGAGTLEHGLAEIGAGDLGVREGALDGEGEIAAAGGEIEQCVRMP